MERYTNVFQGIGKFATFCVDPEITSIECSPHRIPVDVQSPLKDEINRMEHNIICVVSRSTGWVNALVIVADRVKKSEDVP